MYSVQKVPPTAFDATAHLREDGRAPARATGDDDVFAEIRKHSQKIRHSPAQAAGAIGDDGRFIDRDAERPKEIIEPP